MIPTVFDTSDLVTKPRTSYDVLASLVSEVGELAEEVAIQQGHSGKTPGDDGVFGESVDVIICDLDMIHVNFPEITEEDIISMVEQKCTKWLMMRGKWDNKSI